jgi:hypothetical protein
MGPLSASLVNRYLHLVPKGTEGSIELLERQRQLTDEKDDGGNDHMENSQRQGQPTRQQGSKNLGI